MRQAISEPTFLWNFRLALILCQLALGFLTTEPTVAQTRFWSKECHPKEVLRGYLNVRASREARARHLQGALKNCSPEWLSAQENHELESSELSDLESLVVRWPPSRDLRVFLANAPVTEPRPLLIVDLTQSLADVDATDTELLSQLPRAMRERLSQLRVEGEFHLLLVPSQFSAAMISQNQELLAGALTRSHELYQLSVWAQVASPFRGIISSVHLYGERWGGQSVLNSAILNDVNRIADDRKALASVAAICPVVDLRDGARQEYARAQNAITGLKNIERSWPEDRRQFVGPVASADEFTRRWIQHSIQQIRSLRQDFWLNPFRALRPESEDAWLAAHDLLQRSQRAQTAAWILADELDADFDFNQHAGALLQQHRDPKKSGWAGLASSVTKECDWQRAFGWQVSSTLLSTLISGSAWEIWPRNRPLNRNSGSILTNLPALQPGELHVDQTFRALPLRDQALVTYWIWRGDRPECQERTSNRADCVRAQTVEIPLRDLNSRWQVTPPTQVQAEELTRRMNMWLQVRDAQGRSLNWTSAPAQNISDLHP